MGKSVEGGETLNTQARRELDGITISITRAKNGRRYRMDLRGDIHGFQQSNEPGHFRECCKMALNGEDRGWELLLSEFREEMAERKARDARRGWS